MKNKLTLTTLAALAGLAGAVSAQFSINGTGINTIDFAGFTGAGFAPTPAAGKLDSNTWRVTGMSDGDGAFNGTHTTGDFARGEDAGGVTTGGTYAFDTGAGNIALGFQPTGSDFTPGTLTIQLFNNTGFTIESIDLSYAIAVFNDQERANSFNFAHSSDDITYTDVAALNYTTVEVAAVTPAWEQVNRATTISGLSVPNGDKYYLQWKSDDVSGGGSRDEFGLSNVQFSATAVPEPSAAALLSGMLGMVYVMLRRRQAA